MGLIPEPLYYNLKKLNKLRNEFAHNLNDDMKNMDMNYATSDGSSFQKLVKDESVCRIFMYLGAVTFEWLAIHAINNIKENL